MAFASCTLPGRGGEIQASCPVRVQATCRFTPVVWCLPEYSSGCSRHDQQDTKGTVDDVLAVRVKVLHLRYPRLKEFGNQRGVDRHHSRNGGLGNCVDVGQQFLGEIVSERQQSDLDTAEQPQDTGPCCRIGFRTGMCGSVRTG